MLAAAGVVFTSRAAAVDEEAIKLASINLSPQQLATKLAQAKAASLPLRDNVILGFDQVMICENSVVPKPRDLRHCAAQLALVSGKTCTFACAGAAYFNQQLVWSCLEQPTIKYLSLTAAEIENYLAARGEAACNSPAGCQIEGRGIQLIATISGSYFSILGLPLLALLSFLRSRQLGGS